MGLKLWVCLGSSLLLACGDDEGGNDTGGSGSGTETSTPTTTDGSGDGTAGTASASGGGSGSEAGSATGSEGGSGSVSASDSDSASESGGGACVPTDPGRICVRGTPGDGGEDLVEGQPLMLHVDASGCHSSACTVTEEAVCNVAVDGTELTLDASFCLGTEGECSTPDCSGAMWAECESTALEAGDYTVTLGELSVSFTVPSTVEFGGACDGSPF